jgi:hypothetical protein
MTLHAPTVSDLRREIAALPELATRDDILTLIDTLELAEKVSEVKRCGRLTCGLREMQTIPPMNPPLMVCDQYDCDRSPKAQDDDS